MRAAPPGVTGRAVLITGAGSGIGNGVARRFLDEGARVAALDRDGEGVEALAAEYGDDAVLPIVADVCSWGANRDAVRRTVERFGGLDVLIANAGIFDHGSALMDIPGEELEDAFDELFAVNVRGYMLAARAAVEELIRRRGCIVFTASFASFAPAGGGVLYTTSKHAVLGLVRQLAYELAPDVRVNGVAPGIAPTRLSGIRTLGQDKQDSVLPGSASALPLAAIPDAGSYGGLYVMLASRDALAMTGSVISADSGLGIRGIASPGGRTRVD